MSLNFEKVDNILKSYGLISHTIKDGECTEYEFEDRVINSWQKNVATGIKPLLNGGVGGYLYINHLREYDNHPNKTKMGHIPIGGMSENEFRTTLEKVIRDYRIIK